MNMFRSTFGQKARHLFAVNRRAIPDDHQLPLNLTEQMLEESDALRTLERTLSHQCVKLPSRRDTAHHRQMVIGEKRLQHGRVSARGISSDPTGQQIKPRLVNKDNNQALSARL